MSTEFLVAHGRADRGRARAALKRYRRAARDCLHPWPPRSGSSVSSAPGHRAAPLAAHQSRLPARSRRLRAVVRAATASTTGRARSPARAHLRRAQPRRADCRAAASSAACRRCAPSFASCCARARCNAIPRVDVRAPKAGKRLPHTLDVDQMGAAAGVQAARRAAVRDLALMELFYSCGPAARRTDRPRPRRIWTSPTARCACSARAARSASCRSARRRSTALQAAGCASAPRLAAPGREAVFVDHRGAALGAARGAAAGRAPARARRGCRSACIRTCSGIPSPRICLNPVAICAPCRNCSAMPTSAPRRSTPTLISSISPAYTKVRIRVPDGAANSL